MTTPARIATLATLGLLLTCGRNVSAEPFSGDSNLAAPRLGVWGFDSTGVRPDVSPGDDFFAYTNGQWVARTEIPADKTSYGGFEALRELSERRVRSILESAAANSHSEPSSDARKIGDFYTSYMDESAIERLGDVPVKADIARVRAVDTRKALVHLMGQSAERFYGSVFTIAIEADPKSPEHYAVALSQAGLGLPDRDYYLDAKFADKKKLYRAYVGHLLSLIGWPDSDREASRIVAFESRIASASWSRTEDRDPDKTYNPMSIAELVSFAPGFDWTEFLAGADLRDVGKIIVGEKSAFPHIAAIFAQTPLPTLQAWEAFNVADAAAPYLSRSFVEARFEFRNKTLSGQPELAPRWRRAVDAVQNGTGGNFGLGGMGEAVGRVYVEQYFGPEAKASMQALVGNLLAAFRVRIQRLDWMSPPTKAVALEKLSTYTVKIGYPDTWRNYSTLAIRGDDLYGNIERAQSYEWKRSVGRLNRPVDKSEWGLTPQTVNAYNGPTFNEIVFPAAILQPPFFDQTADSAINYGGIGGVIGHEMTHGFDDQGRKYDAQGRLRNWWNSQDAEQFQAQAAKLAKQYSAFEILPGAHVNGDLTMGENIADLGGLSIALDAYHASLHGQKDTVIDGLTGDQRVFLGWAQVWRSKVRDDEQRRLLVADVHAPSAARVNLPVRNIDAWYEAFAVSTQSRSYLAPRDRVHIW